MAKTKISEWSAIAANNTDINGIDIAEGCAPSGINNAIRELMAQVKDQQTGTDADNFTVGGNLSVTGTTTFTGVPTAPTATAGNNTTQLATTAFVTTAVGTLGTMASQNANDVAITGGDILADALSCTGGLFLGNNTGSQDVNIEIGHNRTADGNAYIDFHSALISAGGTGDYDLRIIRIAGANENAFFQNVGTGSIIFNTNGTTRMTLNSAGITGDLAPNFTGSNQSLGANGYQKLPGGLIMQWGTTGNISPNNSVAVTFPIAFPNAVYSVTIGTNVSNPAADSGCNVSNRTTTGFTAGNGDNANTFTCSYMAIGY